MAKEESGMQREERFLAIKKVIEKTSLSRSQIYAEMADGIFPRPVKISGNRVAWPESSIEAWMVSKILASPNLNDGGNEG
jgi:prophage regulatory protein